MSHFSNFVLLWWCLGHCCLNGGVYCLSVSACIYGFMFYFNDKGNMEQTNQTSPARAKSAYFTLVQHWSDRDRHMQHRDSVFGWLRKSSRWSNEKHTWGNKCCTKVKYHFDDLTQNISHAHTFCEDIKIQFTEEDKSYFSITWSRFDSFTHVIFTCANGAVFRELVNIR